MGIQIPHRYGDEDEDEAWLKEFVLSEELIIAHYPTARGGYYRWFQSPNVIDLVRIRRRRFKPTVGNSDGGAG